MQKPLAYFIYGAIAAHRHYYPAACLCRRSRQLGSMARAFGGAQHIIATTLRAKMLR